MALNFLLGFDLVGEESKGHPLDYFLEEFICFRMDCERQGVEIPFLFHCGESREDSEGNLAVALVLQSKRIGHGYALTQYPQILREMVKQNVCVETCPISNEILGLNGEHPLLILLRNGMHCTVNTDNATLFG